MLWRVQLLGGLTLSRGSQVISRFESSRVAALLAYLALFSKHPKSREELMELLWPEEEPEAGRRRLRQALYSLRRQLEPPGVRPQSVLRADRQLVQLSPQAFTCDAVEFEQAARQKRIGQARTLYTGEMLPGFYDDWILTERYRLEEMYERLPEEPAEDTVTAWEQKFQGIPLRCVSLPGYLTEYFGREEERRLLYTQLALHRLITLTGIGGIGKTRLAIEAARAASGDFERIAFVSLEECAAPVQLLQHIPAAFQLPPSQSAPWDQMRYALGERKTLLLLDNFEHLVGTDSAALIEELLTQFPHMTCLITSRRLLGIVGERELPLTPLPITQKTGSLEAAAQSPAIALFLSRAQAARPGFQITESNREDLAALCNALEGLPLALELAASRIRAFSPAEMLRQLADRFRLLARPASGGYKDQRHRSILATLEWSWRLLSAPLQQFLSSLSVFKGGWTAATAAEVCGFSEAEELLETLVMNSLVISEENHPGVTRFRLLEVVRAFIRERLDASESDRLILRHQAAFLRIAQKLGGGNLTALRSEGENLMAALENAIEREDADAAFALGVAVDESWLPLAGPERSLEMLHRALALTGGEIHLRVKMLALASYLSLLIQNRASASALAAEALRLAGSDPALRALALVAGCRVGMVRSQEAHFAVQGRLEEAIALAERAGAEGTRADALRLLGVIATRLGHFSRAEQHMQEALSGYTAVGNRRSVIFTWDNLANNAVQQGDLNRALACYAESRRQAETIGDSIYVAKVPQNLATIYGRQKRWAEALATGQECLRLNQELGSTFILAYALWNIVEPLACLGLAVEAAQIMGFIEHFWTEQYDPLDEEEQGYRETIRLHVTNALGAAAAAEYWNAGRNMTLLQAILLALQSSH